jgi:acyl-coenzyme A thioesterase PaaI-like protein
MPESFAKKIERFKFNLFPAYRRSGGRITFISEDYHEIHVKLPLNWATKNYVGTIFGGSMFAAVDPIYMVMLIKILGRDYLVWDKSANIKFKRPGKETLFAKFVITPAEISEIKTELEETKSVDKIYTIELKDEKGKVHAIIEKTLYLAKKKVIKSK